MVSTNGIYALRTGDIMVFREEVDDAQRGRVRRLCEEVPSEKEVIM